MQADTWRTLRTRVNFLALRLHRGQRRGARAREAAPAAARAPQYLDGGDATKRWALVAACLLGAAALPGCAGYYYGEKYGPTLGTTVDAMLRSDLVEASYRATDALLKTVALDPTQPVVVTTLVNVERPSESSRLGRIVAEQIAGRMVQHGVLVTEMTLRDASVVPRDQGELLLPRPLRDAVRTQGAQTAVVGSYAVSARQLYISLKLIGPPGNAVLAAHDYAVPMDEDVRAMLAAP